MIAQVIAQITLVIWALWILLYWQGGLKIVRDIYHSARQHGLMDVGTLSLMVLSVATILFLLTGLLDASGLFRLKHTPALSVLGLIMVTIGFFGTFYSRNYLGKFWTAETSLKNDHQIIDSGPYRIVRHPIYTFALLLYLGTALVFLHWWVLMGVVLASYAYLVKARSEDQYLQKELPGYEAYAQAVPYRLVPNLW